MRLLGKHLRGHGGDERLSPRACTRLPRFEGALLLMSVRRDAVGERWCVWR